ncbi:MAG TPA: PucR family transcriptional regulator [Clostridia bacterium]|nr:PucR family transcriptional regulator [Clostridia bacterium]
MLRVEEILTLDQLAEFQWIAGQKGLHREVTNVTILDYETDSRDFSSFKEGDFVLTSLFFAKDDASLVQEAFSHLLERKISGMAIKSVYYSEVPHTLIQLADDAQVPVFLYKNSYMEDIIIAVHAYMRLKEHHAYAEGKIRGMVEQEKSPYSVERAAHQIDSMLKPHMVSGYATPVKGEWFEDSSLLYRLMEKHTRLQDGFYNAFFKYKNGVLLLFSSDHPIPEADCAPLILKRFSDIGLHSENSFIGTGKIAHAYGSYDMAIMQSLRANHICRLRSKPYLEYEALGVQRFLFGIRSDSVAFACGKDIVEALQRYDLQNQGALLPTLIAYVKNRGDINQTAAALFQHGNTVRYRIKKAKELLDMEDDFYEQIFLAVYLYLLNDEPM